MFEKLRSYLKRQPKIDPEYHDTIEKLKSLTGISVDNPFLFVRALRHRSALFNSDFNDHESYERLEFLGDAVLDLIVTEIIFDEYSQEDEGFLTKLRAKLVKGKALASYARKLELNSVMLVGERARGQGIENSKSALADVFESLIGAIYVDQGYEAAADFIERVFERFVDIETVSKRLDNYKSILLEYSQGNQWGVPEYKIISESGPPHDKTFYSEVYVNDKPVGKGNGKTKKQAEQQAAYAGLKYLKKK